MMRALTVIVVAAVLAGCKAPGNPAPLPHMQVPAELSEVEPWDVQGRRDLEDPLAFGRWEIIIPASYFTRKTSIGGSAGLPNLPVPLAIPTTLSSELTAFRFLLTSEADERARWSAVCAARFRRVKHYTQVSFMTLPIALSQPGYPHLDCEFTGSQSGQLTLRADLTARRDTGVAEFAGHTWQLRSVNVVDNGKIPWKRYGYEVARDGRAVAAVDCMFYGQVWMLRSLSPSEEDELALVTTTLLYYATLLEGRR